MANILQLHHKEQETSTRKEKVFDMWYKAIYEDDESMIFFANNNIEALAETIYMEEIHGILFNLYLLDDEYNIIKTIM